jgi:hypothetical protein
LPTRKWLSAFPAAGLVLVALWEVAATRCAATSAPDDDAWAEAARVVRAEYKRGDLIVFAPRWIDPVGRLHLGDLISIDDAARMDAAKYARIWELSIRGARADDTRDLDAALDESRGGVRVRRYDRRPAIVVADVRDRLASARVAPGVRPPTLELTEVGFAPHRCVQLVPARDRPARFELPQLPLGTTLVGYVGIAHPTSTERRHDRAAVTLAIEIAGKQAATATAGVDDGWVRFAADTTRGAADVAFVATSDSPDGQLACFAAETRR